MEFPVAYVILALVAAGYVIREAIRAARAKDGMRINFLRLGTSLAVAAGAFTVGLMLKDSITISTEGVTNIWPFVIEVIAAVVFFTALGAAWSAAKGSPAKQ